MLFSFGKSEKLHFSAGDQWSPLRVRIVWFWVGGHPGWARDVEDAVPYGCEFFTPYEFHTPSVSQRPVGRFCSTIITQHPSDSRCQRRHAARPCRGDF